MICSNKCETSWGKWKNQIRRWGEMENSHRWWHIHFKYLQLNSTDFQSIDRLVAKPVIHTLPWRSQLHCRARDLSFQPLEVNSKADQNHDVTTKTSVSLKIEWFSWNLFSILLFHFNEQKDICLSKGHHIHMIWYIFAEKDHFIFIVFRNKSVSN